VLKLLLLTVRFVETLEFLIQHDHKKTYAPTSCAAGFQPVGKGCKTASSRLSVASCIGALVVSVTGGVARADGSVVAGPA